MSYLASSPSLAPISLYTSLQARLDNLQHQLALTRHYIDTLATHTTPPSLQDISDKQDVADTETDTAYLVQLPTALILALLATIVSGVLHTAITMLHSLASCDATRHYRHHTDIPGTHIRNNNLRDIHTAIENTGSLQSPLSQDSLSLSQDTLPLSQDISPSSQDISPLSQDTPLSRTVSQVSNIVCVLLSQPLLLSQALVWGPVIVTAVIMGVLVTDVELLGDMEDNTEEEYDDYQEFDDAELIKINKLLSSMRHENSSLIK